MTRWLAEQRLVLASQSAVRRALLQGAGLAVDVHPADIDERGVEAAAGDIGPDEAAALLAREKARAVAARMPGRFVLGADQTLALGDRRFSKPADRSAARAHLLDMRGRTHSLHAAIAVARDGDVLFEHRDAAHLTMRDCSEAFLDEYLDAAGGAVCKSVGGYQLEGVGVQLFERIEGAYFTILGLPLLPLLDWLRRERLLRS